MHGWPGGPRPGLIDARTAERIRAYEQAHAGTKRLRWPILIALAFGGLMVCGGVLLFVAAHWDALSPAVRFGLVMAMVGGFHVAAALTAERFPGMATTLHAIGTVALGGGIALAGQIFNLDEHWPSGILMWAIGAGSAGWCCGRCRSWRSSPCSCPRGSCRSGWSRPAIAFRADGDTGRRVRRLSVRGGLSHRGARRPERGLAARAVLDR